MQCLTCSFTLRFSATRSRCIKYQKKSMRGETNSTGTVITVNAQENKVEPKMGE